MPIAKSTGSDSRILAVGNKTIVIPANALVFPSETAVHTHPRYWGDDCLEWRPSRWIDIISSSGNVFGNILDNEYLLTPHKGSFIGWSEGVRNCPGKKFWQVEFVGAMVSLFRDWRVEPVPEAAENLTEARKRVMDVVQNDTGLVLLLQLLRPERVALTWKQR